MGDATEDGVDDAGDGYYYDGHGQYVNFVDVLLHFFPLVVEVIVVDFELTVDAAVTVVEVVVNQQMQVVNWPPMSGQRQL